MLHTIVTSTNFKSFVKSLSKKSKFTKSAIPLLTAQEILSQTFSYRNHYELLKNNFNLEINQENLEILLNRFLNTLLKFSIEMPEKESRNLFVSTFGLEPDRKLSIVDIIKEINIICSMSDTYINKMHFFFQNNILKFHYEYKPQNNGRYPALTKDYLENFNSFMVNKYPKIVEHSFGGLFGLANGLSELNPSEQIRTKFLELLEMLFSYEHTKIFSTFTKNTDLFITYSEEIFAVAIKIREGHLLINQTIFERQYLLLEKNYIEKNEFKILTINNEYILHSREMEKSSYTSYFDALHPETVNKRKTFYDLNSAIKGLKVLKLYNKETKKSQSSTFIIVPVLKAVIGIGHGTYTFKDYYFEKNTEICNQSMF